ncbi:alcohol dehydrogenase [Sphingobium sp. AP50]|uniref:alcohol dehydrogenase catalytic domain-containing protein n=1 Tax=Sphingobium sp. AP50 TaxID=1884369 RepID=UPI0008D0375B|nr:alcohol dehydrogenase catalytic domain-containing protein [Sphingobium sp. AP50]SEJ96565.1 alcohol dehydrogenase [Sphingobium sp. AP50]
MKIRAAMLTQSGGHMLPYEQSQPLTLPHLTLDPPGPGELLVRIDAAGLCHSDLSVINGDRPRPMPMVIGHEATGIVESLDEGCDGLTVGDRVVLAFLPACGHCPRCLAGEMWLCGPGTAANGRGTLLSGACRLHDDHGPVHHHLGISAFASHAVVDARSAVKVDSDIPAEIAALFGCAVLTGVGAVVNAGVLRPGENVVIHGLGGVGLSALLGARAAGAATILAIDPSAEKRAIAQELGAHACAPEEAAHLSNSLFAEGGADLVIETVGHAAVLRAAIASGRRGSRIVTVGLPHPDQMIDLPALTLVAEAKTLIGSYLGSCVPARDIPRFIALWKAGRLPVERLLTSVGPLDTINHLLDEMQAGRAIRQIVKP